jgi:methionyl-tRNA formyltransferase
MKIFYIGARIVGYNTLQALLENDFNIIGALILDDSKEKITVAHKKFDDLVSKYNIPTKKFTSLKTNEYDKWIESLKSDLGLIIGVSNLIPDSKLKIPKMGFIGMHPTLLPIGRGRAPIPWTIIKGLKKSGTTLFQCESDADSGKIIAQKEYPVFYEDTCLTLGKRSDNAVIELLINSLDSYYLGKVPLEDQDENLATYWDKRKPDDGLINWQENSRYIYNWIRALTKPYPGAFSYINGMKIMIWSARESFDKREGEPGQIIDYVPSGLLVSTKSKNIVLTEFECENNYKPQVGDLFQS